jgi:hypothetical protein
MLASYPRPTAASLSVLAAAAAMSTIAAHAEDWALEKVATNLEIVSLTDAELAAREIKTITIGELELPTGRIVAADPLVQADRPAFARTVKPGRYPVRLYAAEGRIALAELRFAPGKPARWEIATLPGQNAAELKGDEIFGYAVDAGLGCYMDATAYPLIQAREALVKKQAGTDDINYYDDVLATELAGNADDYALHRPMADSPVNVAIFSSGWGDGFYPAFWGLDTSGEPLVLLTEFYVLEHGDARGAAH